MRALAVALTCLLLAQGTVNTPRPRVISLGADLTPADRIAVIRDFGLPAEVNPGQIPTLVVDHGEEVALLSRVAPPDIIGTRAISSVYIEAAPAGEGLLVSTNNITWVTPAMFANALVTAGVKDAKVVVTAPEQVSGTAALTGIFKAFSYQYGTELSSSAQTAAADELVRTAELGEKVGPGQAVSFMRRTKEEVLQTRAATYREIEEAVKRVARNQNLALSAKQLTGVTNVMVRVSKLRLNAEAVRDQLKNYEEAPPAPTGFRGLIAEIVAFFQNLFKQLFGFVVRFFRPSRDA